jgi:cation transport ATPase
VAGRGVRSQVNGQLVLIGSLKLFQETEGHELVLVTQTVDRLEAEGRTRWRLAKTASF